MLNLLAIASGQVMRLKNGATAEVTGNPGDGIWLHARLADGTEELVFFVIHSAIHSAREDAHCIVHIHSTAGCAVATT